MNFRLDMRGKNGTITAIKMAKLSERQIAKMPDNEL